MSETLKRYTLIDGDMTEDAEGQWTHVEELGFKEWKLDAARLSHDRGADEPDPNRTGMPKCSCGDIAYQPDPVAGRLQAWRCGGCHRTLSKCDCALSVPAPTLPALDVDVLARALPKALQIAFDNDETNPRRREGDIRVSASGWARSIAREYEKALRDAV